MKELVFVICENEVLARLIKRALTSDGYRVVHFRHASNAIDSISTLQPFAILLDHVDQGEEIQDLRAANTFQTHLILLVPEQYAATRLHNEHLIRKPCQIWDIVTLLSRLTPTPYWTLQHN